MAEICKSNKCIEFLSKFSHYFHGSPWNRFPLWSSVVVPDRLSAETGPVDGLTVLLAYSIIRDGCTGTVCTIESTICRLTFNHLTLFVPSNLKTFWVYNRESLSVTELGIITNDACKNESVYFVNVLGRESGIGSQPFWFEMMELCFQIWSTLGPKNV